MKCTNRARFTECYPKSGNSPWIENFYDIGFLNQTLENYSVWAQTNQNINMKGVIDVWTGYQLISHVIGSDIKFFL